MIDDVTHGTDATCTRARVHTLLVDTAQILGTVCINDALWTTLHVRAPVVTRVARAICSIIDDLTIGVDAARGWVTRVLWHL